jgi:integrase
MVDLGLIDGKRPRFFYPLKREAEAKAELERVRRANEGKGIYSLSAAQRVDAEQALALLGPHHKTLVEAAQFLIDNVAVIQSEKTYSQVVTEFLRAKEQDGKRVRYLGDLRNRLAASETLFGDRLIYQIRRSEFDDWLRSLPVASITRNNFRRVLSVLLGYAKARGYVLHNVIREIPVARTERGKPPILSLVEARALMEAADPELIPSLALALFSGLRPESEIFSPDHPLDWSEIDLDSPEPQIDVQRSKSVDSQRYVDVAPNLGAWLAPYRKSKGAVCGIDYYARLFKARQKAIAKLAQANLQAPHLESWPIDVARHTYASNAYAISNDANRTSAQLGHYGGVRVFLRHYKGRVKEADAKEYWEIRP